MKKMKLILSCLCLGIILCGCSKDKIDTYADVSGANVALNSSKGDVLTVGEVYDYIRKNDEEEISKNIMKKIIRSELDFTDDDIVDLYKKYLNEKFMETFVESGTYNYDGAFDETLVVKYLKNESYDISCGNNVESYLDGKYFTCDYSDYIEKELDYDIYLKMLTIQYIIEEKSNLLDKNEGRILNYYSTSRSSTTDTSVRESLERYVKDIQNNHSSTDESLIRSLEDIAELKRDEDLKTIEDEFKKVSTSSDDTFKYLNKYTTCGDKKCTLEEGKTYQENIIMETDYYVNSIVINTNTSVLFESARTVLFGNSLEDYLYEIGDKTYLMSPAYENDGNKKLNDIILFDGESTYYIVEINVVNSSSDFEDKALIAEMLIDSVSEEAVLNHYFEEVEVEIYDKQIREYFVNKYGEY